MKFTDAAPLGGTRITADGYLVTQARAVRTGIQIYAGSEVGLIDMATVRVYRPEGEVRSPASLQSFSHAPVTMGHPAEAVTADNWKDLAVGEVSTAAVWEDDHIALPLILKDAAAIAAVNADTRELSAGYTCTLDHTAGVTPSGEAYDAVQRDIKINHLAIVPRGRAGSTRIGDADHWGATPIPTTSKNKEGIMSDALKTVVLGDAAVNVSAADALAIDKYKADQAKLLADAKAEADKATAIKDAELATKDAEIAKLKAAQMTDAQIDARVAARADLVGKAKALVADVDTVGKSDADIRKAVVVAKRGAAMADKSSAYIDAAFDLLTEDAADGKPDPVREALKDAKPAGDIGAAYAARDTQLSDAWKRPEQKGA